MSLLSTLLAYQDSIEGIQFGDVDMYALAYTEAIKSANAADARAAHQADVDRARAWLEDPDRDDDADLELLARL